MNEPKEKKLNLDLCIIILISVGIFVNVLRLESNFSMDSEAYLNFFISLKDTSFKELMSRLYFPYIFLDYLQVYEVGFVLLSKALSLFGLSGKVLYGLLIALCVALKIYVLRKMGCPWLGIILINLYALTLLDANALRLGIAVSTALYALYLIGINKSIGWLVLFICPLLHLQSIMLVLPLTLVWIGKDQIIKNTVTRLTFAMLAFVIGYLFVQLLPFVYYETSKLITYTESEFGALAAGLSLPAVLSLTTLISALFWQNHKIQYQKMIHLYNLAIIMGFFSISILLFSYNIAVVGDRIWQPTLIILSAFIFSTWEKKGKPTAPIIWISATLLISNINIIYRYPQSNFFYPLTPHADTTLRVLE